MDSKQIEYILAIAEEKSFTKAAERLFLSQSALSQQVAKLRKEGLPPLFSYTNGEVTLTDAGKIYVHGAYQIQKVQHDTEELMTGAIKGAERPVCLNLSLCTGMKQQFYNRVLLPLHGQYPGLHINFFNESVRNAKAMLINGDLDLVFFYAREVEENAANQIILGREELVLAYSTGAETDEPPLILPPSGTYLRDISDFAIEQHGLRCGGGIETTDFSACISLIRNGIYQALIPRSTAISEGFTARQFEPPIDFYYGIALTRERHSKFLSDICDLIRVRLCGNASGAGLSAHCGSETKGG